MSRFGQIALLVWVLGGATMPAAAQWMWRDEAKGNQVTFSDRPPPPYVQEKDILKRPNANQPVAPPAPTASEATLSAPPLIDPKLEAKRKENEKQAAEQKKKESDELASRRAENCQRAKNYLVTLEQGMRVASINKQGEREVLDDSGRTAEIKRARDIAAKDCK